MDSLSKDTLEMVKCRGDSGVLQDNLDPSLVARTTALRSLVLIVVKLSHLTRWKTEQSMQRWKSLFNSLMDFQMEDQMTEVRTGYLVDGEEFIGILPHCIDSYELFIIKEMGIVLNAMILN